MPSADSRVDVDVRAVRRNSAKQDSQTVNNVVSGRELLSRCVGVHLVSRGSRFGRITKIQAFQEICDVRLLIIEILEFFVQYVVHQDDRLLVLCGIAAPDVLDVDQIAPDKIKDCIHQHNCVWAGGSLRRTGTTHFAQSCSPFISTDKKQN